MQPKHCQVTLLLLLVVGLLATLFGSVTLADQGQHSDRIRSLDGFALPERWDVSELDLQPSKDTLADGRPTLHVHIDVDHTKPQNVPIGWPRMYLQIEPEEKGWAEYARFEFLILGRTDRPRDSGIPAVFHVMCPYKDTGAAVSIQLPRQDVWTRVSIPIGEISNVDQLGSLHFYIGDKRYAHGEQVDFYMGAFRLVRAEEVPGGHGEDGVQITR